MMDVTEQEKILFDIALAREEFLSTGKVNSTLVRPEIKESWLRSRAIGIDPDNGSSSTMLSEPEFANLLFKKKNLITIAIPFMKRFYEVISNSGFAVVLTDEQGFILEIARDAARFPGPPGIFL